MAYDPKDPADVKIVQGLIDTALADQATEHEADITGLKTKNADLLVKLKAANKGEGDPAEVARLEGEIEAVKGQLKEVNKKLSTSEKALATANEGLTAESAVTKRLIVDNGLTAALVENKVAPQYLDAVKALLGGQVTVKQDGENRTAVVGDKPLGEFVKEWSQGDQGKHYVAAAVNGGGSAPGGKADGTPVKTATRAQFDAMAQSDRMAHITAGGAVTEA